MGKGAGSDCRGAMPIDAAAAEAAEGTQPRKPTDPVLEEIIALMGAGGRSAREQRDALTHLGLLIRSPNPAGLGLGRGPVHRYRPSTLASIILDKRRLPTPAETARTIKRLDQQLKQAGVKGDVTSGSYFSPTPSNERSNAELHHLISDRKSIAKFEDARKAGRFEAVKIRNAAARAAQAKLAERLDRVAEQRPGYTGYSETADTIRSGVFSPFAAREALQQTAIYREAEDKVERDAICLGLGLATEHQQLKTRRDRTQRNLRGFLDRVATGENITDYDSEGDVSWSPRQVQDRRVRRAAFGLNADAARIMVDYRQQAIIELDDGYACNVTVKRAHSDLEGYVEEVIDNRDHESQRINAAAAKEEKAAKLLRRWARNAPPVK